MTDSLLLAALPLLCAALGGLISERAGVLNIGLEGCITAGAFCAAALCLAGLPSSAAFGGAVLSGAAAGLLISWLHLSLRANLFIVSMGINLLIPALRGLISQALWNQTGAVRFPFSAQPSAYLPWAVFPVTLAAVVLLKCSATGRRLRTVGSCPEFMRERGLSPERTQCGALVISSAAAAAAGALTAFRIGAFVPGMSSGRGWVALVMIWLGFRRPAGILAASCLFAAVERLSVGLQGSSVIPAALTLSLPYAAALLGLIAASAVSRKNLFTI